MIGVDDVKGFLEQFNIKAQVFGILFRDDRPKNREALEELEITLGYENGQTICISFHIAEYPLEYPFK